MVRGEASYRNTLRLSREAKRRRTGTCRVCGVTTRYSGHAGKAVSDLCPAHAAQANGARLRGSGPLAQKILAYLDEPRRFSEIRDELGMGHNTVSPMLNKLVRYGLIERVSRGVYVRVK